MAENKPLTSVAETRRRHREFYKKITRYAASKYGFRNLDDSVLDRLLPESAVLHYATNPFARIAFSEAAHFELKAHAINSGIRRYQWLTFIPSQFAVSLKYAGHLSTSAATAWLDKTLAGFDYFGVVEPAFYTRLPLHLGRRKQAVSWHFHVLLWNCSTEQMEAWASYANRFIETLIPTLPAADVWEVSPESALGKTIYMMKGPIREYRAAYQPEVMPGADPECPVDPIDHYEQWKQDIRPGNAAKLCAVLGHREVVPENRTVG